MKMRLVSGYFLLISALSLCVDGQLTGILVVGVDAKANVLVSWFIYNGDTNVNVTFTVCYATNLADTKSFNSSSPGATKINATDPNYLNLTNIQPATDVTVVVVANSSVGSLESSPITRRTFQDVTTPIPAPMNVMVDRIMDDKTLKVRWSAINIQHLLSYDIAYRMTSVNFPSVNFPSTIVNIPASELEFDIPGVSANINYEVRVRGVIEVAGKDEMSIAMNAGSWSPWVVSQVKLDQGGLTGGSSTSAVYSGLIFTTWVMLLSLAVLFF